MPQSNLTKVTTDLVHELEEASKLSHYPEDLTKIRVSELTSLPAFAYEKIRNFIDYKDEFLLRKNAIRRFLKRKFWLPQFNHQPQVAAQALIRELILARYLANNAIPETKITAVAAILSKYYALFNLLADHKSNIPKWREQLLGLAAVECDNQLVSPDFRNAYISFAYKILKDVLILPDNDTAAEPKNVQLIIDIQRALERADSDIINYYLLVHYYPYWFNNEPAVAVPALANSVDEILLNFKNLNDHELGRRLLTRVRRLLVPVIILQDILRDRLDNWRGLLTNAHQLESTVRQTYQKYWKTTSRKLRRRGWHAIIYIFLTKMVLALLLEIPYERLMLGSINYLSVIINLLVPPVLMGIITVMIKSPSQADADMVAMGVNELVFGYESNFYRPQPVTKPKMGLVKKIAYTFLYVATFVGSFGGVIYLLWRLDFNLISGIIFIFFVSLVSFFGISLRQHARQLKVVRSRETIVAFLLDFFAVPVIAVGKWLSQTFDRVNVFVFVLDFLFEVPFKTALKIIEDWFQFLKDKKDEMY